MENKRGTTVLLTVIGIATLLVAVVGATFAYFTATVEPTGDSTEVTIQTATLGNVTFNQGNVVALAAENAYPNARTSKSFTVQAAPGTVNYNYSVYMDVTSDFVADPDADPATTETNMQYQLCQVTETETCAAAKEEDSAWTNILTTDNTITLVDNKEMVVDADAAVTDSYVVFVRLHEIGAAQNYDQGKSFAGSLRVEFANLDGNTGYTTDADGNQVTTNIAG